MRVSLVRHKIVIRAYVRYQIKQGNITIGSNGDMILTESFKMDIELGKRIGIGPPGMVPFILEYLGK